MTHLFNQLIVQPINKQTKNTIRITGKETYLTQNMKSNDKKRCKKQHQIFGFRQWSIASLDLEQSRPSGIVDPLS